MKLRITPAHCLPLLVLTLALSACGRAPAPSSSASTDTGSAAAPGGTAASTPAPATGASNPSAPVSAGDLNAQADTHESAESGGTDTGEASLERVAKLPAAAQLPAGKWVAGTNYTVLSPAQPTDAPAGQVEVLEVFWYGCPHCYALDPYLQSWQQSKPGYIDFVRVPIMWADEHRAHARLFYTLQALGKLDQLHSRVFDEIHQHNDLLYVAGNANATLQAQEKFAEANGISGKDFEAAYNSFGVQTDLQKADALDQRYRIDAVPTIIIDGKYETDVGMAGGEQQLVQLINDLAASEKKLQSG
jgi:thiol:disulfide interchange protein DsbA